MTAAVAAGQSQPCSVTVAQSNIVDLKPQHEAMYASPVKTVVLHSGLLKELRDPTMLFLSDSRYVFSDSLSIFYNDVKETKQQSK